MKIIVKWLLCAASLLLVTYVYSGVQVQGFSSAMIAALVIGLLNTVIRPILVVLTLPVTIITVGLFLFVVNGLMFWMASGILGGFHVSGFWAAMLGALIYSALGLFVDALVARLFPE
ncbi:MAG: phage holin family protein [Comamonas sp.]|uniref:phage holin family protein n=1 Tax=Comamonas TaxID=283 RepID=UPI000EB2E006|nr:phage holin family protein [Comamonas sp. lk]